MEGVNGKVIFITGATGVICSEIAKALAKNGAKLILGYHKKPADALLEEIKGIGSEAIDVKIDVVDKEDVKRAVSTALSAFGRIDVLINGAGGNDPKATTSSEVPFFDLPLEEVKKVFDINFTGAFICSQVFGRVFAEQKSGAVLNISSMSAIRPMTRVPAYSAAKAALSNFTQWLAVEMAMNYSPEIRVNAIAPGFLLTEQNRFLLLKKNGELSERGKRIIEHTPQGKFGEPKDLISTVLWLLSPGSEFVTGITVPIDGGFSAYAGV